MPVQALVLVPLAIRVDDFSGAARTRASYWAVGNSLLTNSWASHPPTRLMLKGATWNGLERGCRLGGAWSTSTALAARLEALRRAGFNAIRVPLALSGCPPEADDELEQLVTNAVYARARPAHSHSNSCRGIES